MPLIDPNELMFTVFQPKLQNRYIFYVDGIPSYLVSSVGGFGYTNSSMTIYHMNVYFKIATRAQWDDITLRLYNPVSPSGEQVVLEWIKLQHEITTGRDGYPDFYKKDAKIEILGPVGDIVGEWILKGAFPVRAAFGSYSWENTSHVTLDLTLAIDYLLPNF